MIFLQTGKVDSEIQIVIPYPKLAKQLCHCELQCEMFFKRLGEISLVQKGKLLCYLLPESHIS